MDFFCFFVVEVFEFFKFEFLMRERNGVLSDVCE